MRLVLDTNIYISALISPGGSPSQLLLRAGLGGYDLITSDYQLAELDRTFGYPKFVGRFTPEQASALLAGLEANAEVVYDLPEVNFSQDDKDNPILATAIAGRADLLVSNDRKHMLSLGQVETIPIVHPSEALVVLDREQAQRRSEEPQQ